MTGAGGDDGWVSLGSAPWWLPVIGMSPTPLLFLYPPLFTFQLSVMFQVPLPWAVALAAVACAGCLAFGLGLVRLVYPPVFLNPRLLVLRAGRKRARYMEITSAQLITSASPKRRSVTLVLRSASKLRGAILLRDARQHALAPDAAELVMELLELSSVALPVSPDDPKGRFTRYNFPGYLTKEQALELVAHPPRPADRLPTDR